MSLRKILFAAIPLATMLVACGGDDGGTTTPEGEHYKYAAKSVLVPANSGQAREFGLDIGSADENDTLDGTVDNQLGMVLGTLAGQGIDVQASLSEALADGSIILLADLQTTDLASSSAAGMQVRLGENPTPAACNAGEMPVCTAAGVCTGCSHHLDGTGSFDIAATSPDDAAVAGKIVNGTFTGGDFDSNIALQIALGGADPINLSLIGARAKASSITATGIGTLVIAGAISEETLNTQVLPAIQSQLGPTIDRDCPLPRTAPDCNCMAGSTGKTVLGLFDGKLTGSTADCSVSLEEIQGNAIIKSLLAPDVVIGDIDALSLGLKLELTGAAF